MESAVTFKVEVHFTDGTHEIVDATYAEVYNDQLHVRYKDGEFAQNVHVGSYPLVNIRKWRSHKDMR